VRAVVGNGLPQGIQREGEPVAIGKPTLIVHTVYFAIDPEGNDADEPERPAAIELGEQLYDLLTRPRADRLAWGAGVPVRVGTSADEVDHDEAEHVVVVPVLGEYTLTNEDLRQKVMAQIHEWSTKGRVISVLTWEGWRFYEAQMAGKPLLTDLAPSGRSRTIDEIVLAIARLLAGENRPATRPFISYAVGDLPASENAAKAIAQYFQDSTTSDKPFFDRVSLLAGEDLAAQIDDNAGAGVFIAVRSDSYSSRAWCVRELLRAKQKKLPILTVEVLSQGERRSAPYSGNAPTIVWQRGAGNAAARVVTLAMVECVRNLLFAREASRVTAAAELGDNVVQLPRPPELLDLPALRDRDDGVLVVLHPDPELSVHERALLEEADKRIRTVTPTTAFTGLFGSGIRAPLDGWQVALSLSETPNIVSVEGLQDAHVHDATVFIARTLLSAGAAIAYGGDFRAFKTNYTEMLAQLVAAYNQTARKQPDLLHSYLAAHFKRPATFQWAHTSHHLGRYGTLKKEARLPQPELDGTLQHHGSLYVSDMRRVMERHTQARVVLYGNTTPKSHHPDGYGGRYPGVVEEAWRTLQIGHPLFVAGGFGGAAGLVADILEHDKCPSLLDEATWAGNPEWNKLVGTLDKDAGVGMLELPKTQNDLVDAIRSLGRSFLANDQTSERWNGLSRAENLTLFRSRDVLTIASLVMKGLIKVAAQQARGKLKVELVEGDVSCASDLDVMVFPTFTNVRPSGVASVLDGISGHAATRAHREGRPVPSANRAAGARFLYASDLGHVNDAMGDSVARVKQAAQATAVTARRYRFSRIGIVTFLGNVTERLEETVIAMIDGLRGCPDGTQLVWYENDPARAALLASIFRGQSDLELSHVVAPIAAPEPPRGGKQRTIVAVRQVGQELDVAVLVPQANGLAPNPRSLVPDDERKRLAGTVFDATPSAAELRARGTRIQELLFGKNASRVLTAIGDSEVVILHDAPSSGFPYEALTWEAKATPVTPATRGGIVRHLLVDASVERGLPSPPHAGKVGVLVIINPRGDLAGAEAEGRALVEALEQHPDVEVRKLERDEATVERVLQELADPNTDVVHYCGHAFYRGPGEKQSGLNLANDTELTLDQLRSLTRVPRLAVFNACQAGRVRGEPEFRAPQTFAEFFLHAGVDAYLGTFWEVSDAGAADFAAELYKQLGDGRELGDAVVEARKRLQGGLQNDWANYVLYGRVGFRLVRGGGMRGGDPSAMPAPSVDSAGNRLVARWMFPAASAPESFLVSVTERFTDSEEPIDTTGPIGTERRDGWHDGAAIVQWIATVDLPDPVGERAFRFRASTGDPVDIGTPQTSRGTRGPNDAFAELETLRTILNQQPDRGRTLLTRLLPTEDPEALRAAIDTEIERVRSTPPDRAIWPFNHLDHPAVDVGALTAFANAYKLTGLDKPTVASQLYQTKEDWERYASARGGAKFHIGFGVQKPLSEELNSTAADMTHPVRDGEVAADGSIEVALFADNGNALYPSAAIAKQIVDAHLPYAFHLGDVYYGGKQAEFEKYFEAPLRGMFDRTELFMITGNHEMYAKGEWFKDMIRRKGKAPSGRQRQVAESFCLRGPSFQIIGLDTMFVDWDGARLRLDDYANEQRLRLLDTWLSERPNDFTVLLTSNEAWTRGSKDPTRLYRSLRETIGGRVDLWFWGNVHYAALYDMWAYGDPKRPLRQLVTSCIGHGGYPFYTQTHVDVLPRGVTCRWYESKSRFWPESKVRPDVGLNGWCRMKLKRESDGWDVTLTYIDWVGRERARAHLGRKDEGSIYFKSVEESDIASVGAPLTWHKLELGSVK
jgi:hypothetical protein